jgi:hypothetical protein
MSEFVNSNILYVQSHDLNNLGSTRPLMVAKFNYKTHLFKTVFPFFQPFRSHLPSKFVKSDNMITKNHFQNAIWVSKTAELDADFESFKKDAKNSCKKVINENVTEKLNFLL